MSVSVPVASEPAGTVIVALPPLRVVEADVYPPPLKMTEPVGVGLLLPPLTPTVTVVDCVVEKLAGNGETVTVGVAAVGNVVVVA